MLKRSVLLASLACCIAAVGLGADLLFNEGRLLSVTTGQTAVEDACLPELRKTLARRGFLPSDIVLAQRPGYWLGYRAKPKFTSDFSFEDGPEETRVDGTMACELDRGTIRVEVATTARPIRAT